MKERQWIAPQCIHSRLLRRSAALVAILRECRIGHVLSFHSTSLFKLQTYTSLDILCLRRYLFVTDIYFLVVRSTTSFVHIALTSEVGTNTL